MPFSFTVFQKLFSSFSRKFRPVHTYPEFRILLNPYTAFLSGYAFRPHASGESDLRIRKLLNPLSRMETFESDIFRIHVDGRIRIPSNPMTLQGRVQSLQWARPRGYKTTWRPTKTFYAVLNGLRVLGKTPNLYSRLSLKFYILHTE